MGFELLLKIRFDLSWPVDRFSCHLLHFWPNEPFFHFRAAKMKKNVRRGRKYALKWQGPCHTCIGKLTFLAASVWINKLAKV